MKLNPTFLEIVLLFTISAAIALWVRYEKRLWRWWQALWKKQRKPPTLKPRSPEACPRCAVGLSRLPWRARREIVPWGEVKGQAGRKKRVDTKGYACMNRKCMYHRVSDPAVHALVSEGKRGMRKDILYLKCQACGKKQTSRLDTPLKDLKTPVEQVEMVVTALAEGLDLSAASRVFGHHPTTIARWVWRCGIHGARLHERLLFRVIEEGHVQLDELVTRVKSQVEKVFVWTAVVAKSKTRPGGADRREDD